MSPTTISLGALHTFTTRSLSTGASAGAAIGAAAAGILLIVGLVFFALWHRKRHSQSGFTRSPTDGAEKGVGRCGSCKRPQHKHNHDDNEMPTAPKAAAMKEGNGQRDSFLEQDEEGRPLGAARPWLHGNGSRASFAPSFSSRRATRMMMVM